MKTDLTTEQLKSRINYNPETGEFSHATRKSAGTVNSNGYLKIEVFYKKYAAHRLAWLWVYGKFPEDQLDHINGNKLDNRIANLRECSATENNRNVGKRSTNTSGYKGVAKVGARWRATIGADAKHIGYFSSAKEAAQARDAAAALEHGQFFKAALTDPLR